MSDRPKGQQLASVTMSQEECEAYLARPLTGVISIARKDKAPLTVPTWYLYQPGGEIAFILEESSYRGKLIKRYERISLCVHSGDDLPPVYVTVEGELTGITPATPDDLFSLAVHYLGEARAKRYVDGVTGGAQDHSYDLGDTVIMRIRPDRWISTDYKRQAFWRGVMS